jgi:hypothetical protein
MKHFYALFSFLFLSNITSQAQIALANTTPVVQNFDGMGATTTLPSFWKMASNGSTAAYSTASSSVTQQASSGAPSTGGTYNFGQTASERAVGAMTSGSYSSPNNLMAWYKNTNASNLTSLSVSYVAERYRINSAAASIQFYYSTDGSTWTSVSAGDIATSSFPTGSSAYNFTTGTRVVKTAIAITGLSIANNADIYLRWNINTTGSNSQGIAVDSVAVAATFAAACTNPTSYTVSGGGSYCTGGAGVDVNLSNSETGVRYILLLGSTAIDSMAGTGNAISFTGKTTAGTYTILARRITGGCTTTMSGSATIGIYSLPTAGITNNTGTTILSVGIPSINVTATGGTTYVWSGGSSTNTAANSLSTAGTYTVTVTNSNNCKATASITITGNSSAPTAGITNSTGTSVISCNNPSISVTATGGNTYAWSGGSSTNTAANSFSTAGTYIVTVTDASSNTATASITITGNTNTPTAGITNNTGNTVITCPSPTKSLTATGGTSYLWSGGSSTNTANNTISAAGTYTVTVTAANSCTASASITITGNTTLPTAGITNNTGTTAITCAIPSISVTATGGGTYAWSGGATPATANNALSSAATYRVTVTAANSCTAIATLTVTGSASAASATVANSNTSPQNDASITPGSFTANWGAVAEATSYILDVYTGGATSTTETFSGIGGGTATSYQDRSWTGADGIAWDAYGSRTDQTIVASNSAITLENASGSYIQSDAISGNPTSISFDVQQKFTGSGGVITTTILSGPGFGTATVLGNSSYSTTIATITLNISGITGPFKIKLANNASARPCIDNLTFNTNAEVPVTGSPFTITGGSANTFNVSSGLTPGTTYYYRVRASNSCGTSANSNVVRVDIPLGASFTSGSLAAFGSVCTGTSATQSFTLSGSNLDGSNGNQVSISSVATQLSFSLTANGTYSNPLTFNPATTFSNQSIYVKFTPTAATGYSPAIAIAGGGASTSINMSGTGLAPTTPTLTIGASPSGAICAGTSVTFTGTTGNLGGSSVQNKVWYINGSPAFTGVDGFTSTTLNNGDQITAIYTTTGGCVTSNTASSSTYTMTVNPLPANPTGNTNPASGSIVCNGPASVSFAVASTPLGNYWQTSATGTVTTQSTATNYTLNNTGTIYVRTQNPSTGCWSAGAASSSITVLANPTVSIAPNTTQNIITGTNGTTLTATETNVSSRNWYYSTISGGPYTNSLSNTSTTYTPNFPGVGTYYVVCESENFCNTVTSNQVRINVTTLSPPTVAHTALTNTISTASRSLPAVITSLASLSATPVIRYRINGGSFQSATGTYSSGTLSSGATYTFSIPGQTAGSLIEYYIEAQNSAGIGTSPSGVNTTSAYGSFHEYQIDCTPVSSSGTKTIAFQGFEFVGSPSYAFTVNNTSSTPTGTQNYPAHSNAAEWKYYNQGANGTASASNRNSCGCMNEVFSGLPGCPNASNPIYTAGGSTGVCRTFSGNSRGVYLNTPATTENPANSRSRNGSYSYIQQSRTESGSSPASYIYFNDIAIPDAANATNIKVIAYISSISTSTLSNGAESTDVVSLDVKYNSSNSVNTMVTDPSCGSDWFFYSSSAGGSVAGTTNQRWDFAGNSYDNAGTASGTVTKNKIVVSVPNGTTNVQAIIRMLNDDSGNSELWAVDDVQIIADYPEAATSDKRYYRSRQNGKWENSATWQRSDVIDFSTGVENACDAPTNANSDSIFISAGTKVRISTAITADQIHIKQGGILEHNTGLTLSEAANSVELNVEGTFIDNASSANGITFSPGTTWKLGPAGTIIKTNDASAADLQANYQGGITNIPDGSAGAIWIVRYTGAGNPIFSSTGMLYPNLTFESTTGFWNPSGNTSRFQGSTGGYPTIKGNLDIGGTGSGTVAIYNQNTNAQPVLVLGNTTVRSGCTLTITGTATGTGFELKGNLTVTGTFDVNNNASGLLVLSGSGTQTISGNGAFDLWDAEVKKPAQTIVDMGNNLSIRNTLAFTTGGIVKTNTNILSLQNASVSNAITGYMSPNNTGTYSDDKYVYGKLERVISGNGIYIFPVGDAVSGEGYNPVKLNIKSGTGKATAKFTAGDPGLISASGTITSCITGAENFYSYTGMTGEGWWNFESSTNSVFNYDIYVHPNAKNTNTRPNETTVANVNGQQNYFNASYRVLKAPSGTAGGTWPASAATGGDMCAVSTTYYEIPGMNYTGFSDFAPGGGDGSTTALPVKLIDFTAKAAGLRVSLDWITATEINSDHFVVEKSTNAAQYTELTMVKAAGNSTQKISYHTWDDQPNYGANYYRLKQVDIDGTFEYSPIRVVMFGDAEVAISVFPNPVKNILTLTITNGKENPEVQLLDVVGNLVEVKRFETGAGVLNFDLGQLPKGYYFININGNTIQNTIKVLKID